MEKVKEWLVDNEGLDTRCLVIGVTKPQVQDLATLLEVPAFHSGLAPEQKHTVFNAWLRGTQKIMVATSGCSTGIDVQSLNCVIMVSAPYDAMSLIQTVGRVGRNGEVGMAYVYVPPFPTLSVVEETEDLRGVNVLRKTIWEETQCRWAPLMAYNDGRPMTCASLSSLCDLCARRKARSAALQSDRLFQ
jgi:ATP-dependent DNA helicase RecQ